MTRWYLAFVGLTTIPIEATCIPEATEQVRAHYRSVGITLGRGELKVRRARPDDAGWLRDSGASAVADAVSSG